MTNDHLQSNLSALEDMLGATGLRRDEIMARLAGMAAAPINPFRGPDLGILSPALRDNPAITEAVGDQVARLARGFEQAMGQPSAPERLARLRAELARRDLDGFIVPRADEHQGEYVAARAQRLAWLTGFDGSAGCAVVLADGAAVFVDGRYTEQVRVQADPALYEFRHLIDQPPTAWMSGHVGAGKAIGYDPWLHTVGEVARYRRALGAVGATLVAVADNPIDALWDNQPPQPLSLVVAQDLQYAGEASVDKRRRMGRALGDKGATAAVLTAPDSIAWLLNVRGGDISHTPYPLSFAVLAADGGVDWFIDRRKLAPDLSRHLGDQVALHPVGEFGSFVKSMAGREGMVLVDPAMAPAWVFDQFDAGPGEVLRDADPCQLAKACKNKVELDGTRAAHVRDGAALTRFLAWLAARDEYGELDEVAAADELAAFRATGEGFRDLSFDTISGAGANGAIVHYRARPGSCRTLRAGELFLVDSGGQYVDGTTDVTRTVALGTPTAEMRDRFTRVLQGHIALASCRFPKGTSGSQLDILARLPLWRIGLDYDHGTGHGVGSYLNVHEGPQRISKLPNAVALKPGMILSNEPGFYKAGAFGIRIENLVVVARCEDVPAGARPQLCFETITLAPIDLNLVEPGLMTDAEITWLNDYHARVRTALAARLDARERAWLAEATRSIRRA